LPLSDTYCHSNSLGPFFSVFKPDVCFFVPISLVFLLSCGLMVRTKGEAALRHFRVADSLVRLEL